MTTETTILLRVAVDHAPAGRGVVFGLQDKSGRIIGGASGPGDRKTFEAHVRVASDGGTLTFLGPFTHGPPANRHLYLSQGRSGREGWVKRIKLPLTSITPATIAAAGGRDMETVVDGRSAATVRTEWRIGQAPDEPGSSA
ncbi:MAG TPA: DUF5990 family protein [Candidatus Angelobacter sp.]|nr:DUF5990 family protein [Candidatus Angelobacter sp.]